MKLSDVYEKIEHNKKEWGKVIIWGAAMLSKPNPPFFLSFCLFFLNIIFPLPLPFVVLYFTVPYCSVV
jgi:hypothetical protein